MKDEYPALRLYSEFDDLSDSELRWVWNYSCKSSDFYKYVPKARIHKLTQEKPELFKDADEVSISQYLELSFEPRILTAMKVMENFNEEVRTRADNISNKILKDWERIIAEGVDKYMAADPSDMKKYVDIQATIIGNLDTLVKTVENGFGVTKVSVKKEQNAESMWEKSLNKK